MRWATSIVANKIKVWKVELEKLSLSDHSYITFRIGIGKAEEGRSDLNRSAGRNNQDCRDRSTIWKIETLDQEIYDQILEWKCSERSEEVDA